MFLSGSKAQRSEPCRKKNMPVSRQCDNFDATVACLCGTILVQMTAYMHYNGAAVLAAAFILSIKSTGCGTHYFGTLNAIVFVTRPGQTGRFFALYFWRKDS